MGKKIDQQTAVDLNRASKVSILRMVAPVDLTDQPTGMYILQVATDKMHESRSVALRN